MSEYDANKFIEEVNKKATKHNSCPFCGANKYTTPQQMATIIVGKDFQSLSLKSSVPAGMIICSNCGHIDFFALGALGMLQKKGEEDGSNQEK